MWTREKAFIGLPFYVRNYNLELKNPDFPCDPQANPKSYYCIIENYPYLGPEDDYADGYYFNGINTIKRKTCFAKQKAGGVMIWSLEQDSFGEKSLLKAINTACKPIPWVLLLND